MNYNSGGYMFFLRWLGINLGIIGSTLSLFACIFAVLARETLSPGLAGLSITNSLNVKKKEL